MRRYVIIGSGPAGVAAAEAIRGKDASGHIIILGDEPAGYYSRPGLAYYLTGELPEDGLFPFAKTDFRKLNISLVHARAVRIDALEHQVFLDDGSVLGYDRLLLATGARAAMLNVPGSDLAGVVKLDNLADARRILKLVRKVRSAVVVGGGITALELVEGLNANRVKVHYFLRKDRYWSNVLDETESRIVEHQLEEDGVKIHFHTELEEILGKRGKVAGVKTKDGKLIKCQMVAVAVGIRPRIELARQIGLDTDRGILVDEYLQTPASDIFAAGDVAQVFDPFTGKTVIDSLWAPARGQGHIAGLNMAGSQLPYLRTVPFNVTRLAGLTTTIIGTVGRGVDADLYGIARGDSETWRQLPDAIAAQTHTKVHRLRLLLGKQYIIGAVVMGDQTLSQPVYNLISEKVDITPIRDQLLSQPRHLGDIIADFWATRRKTNATA